MGRGSIIAVAVAALALPGIAGASTGPQPVGPTAPVGPTQPVGPTSSRPETTVTVRPGRIHAHTWIRLRFRQPQTTGMTTTDRMSESVQVSGPTRAGCIGAASITLAAADAGTTMNPVLSPRRLGGRWCTGTYHGAVTLSTDPVCDPGPVKYAQAGVMACPMFVLLPRTVAAFRFRVVAG